MSYLAGAWQSFAKQFLILGLISLMALAGILGVMIQPSYAGIPLNSKETGLTKGELTGKEKGAPLSAEEKIERAYTIRESVGIHEENKLDQEELSNQAKNPRVLGENEEDRPLVEKVRDFFSNSAEE